MYVHKTSQLWAFRGHWPRSWQPELWAQRSAHKTSGWWRGGTACSNPEWVWDGRSRNGIAVATDVGIDTLSSFMQNCQNLHWPCIPVSMILYAKLQWLVSLYSIKPLRKEYSLQLLIRMFFCFCSIKSYWMFKFWHLLGFITCSSHSFWKDLTWWAAWYNDEWSKYWIH